MYSLLSQPNIKNQMNWKYFSKSIIQQRYSLIVVYVIIEIIKYLLLFVIWTNF